MSGGSPRPQRTLLPWWSALLAALAAAAVAFAIGWFLSPGPDSATPATDSAEAGFARDMQEHHAQAVEMAMELYRETDDSTLRALAYDLATSQSQQLGEMYSWLVRWDLPQQGGPLMAWMTSHDHGGHDAEEMTDDEARAAMGMATPEQLAAFMEATGTEADCQFLTLMTRHHEGAIEMVDGILEQATEPRVRQVAEGMKDTQQFEIDSMAASAARLGCS